MVIKILWIICAFLIFLNGLYFSFKLHFVQFRFLKFFSLFKRKKINKINSVDTLFISLASKIGIGSIAGTALSIYYGGIGTVFWIWIISFFTSIICFIENFLATKYQICLKNCKVGGPAFYIRDVLKNNYISIIFSILAIITYIFCFMTIQNNTITFLLNDLFSIPIILSSMLITILFIFSISNGIDGISNICKKIVPIMSIIYIFIGLVTIVLNISFIKNFFIDVFILAFEPSSIHGSILFVLLTSLKRSVFATESGMGTSSSISGASFDSPLNEGYNGIICTYFISFIVITITAFIIYTSYYSSINVINGIELARFAFHSNFYFYGDLFLLVILFLFAFSSIITAFYYGESNLKNICLNKKVYFIFKIIVIITLFVGGIVESTFIWNLSDFFIGILTIINLISIFKLRKVIINDYYAIIN